MPDRSVGEGAPPARALVAAAHQSCFLPWLGYLHKMSCCDVFILLDDVQFPKRNYVNRVQIKGPSGALWLTVPASVKGRFEQRIKDVLLAPEAAPEPLIRSLQHAHARSPHFEELSPAVFERLRAGVRPGARLVDLNEALLAFLVEIFGLKCRIVRQSELSWTGHRNEMLISLCQAVGAGTYLSGRLAAAEYMEPEAFARQGISVEVQQFEHPVHPQRFGAFLPGLSAVDAIFNCGRAAASLLQARQAPAMP